jgi:hypothetical protein
MRSLWILGRVSNRNLVSRGGFEQSVVAGCEVIEALIARRLRVSLNPDDARASNQRALDLVSDTRARLIEILRQAEVGGSAPVRDVRALAARLAQWACRDLFDERNPAWRQTRDRLYYFLTRAGQRGGYGLWEGPDRVPLTGLVAWRDEDRPALEAAAVGRYLDDPSALGVGPLPAGSVERLKPAGWHHVLSRLFLRVQRPVPLPQLVRLVRALFAGPLAEDAESEELPEDRREERATADQVVELKELTACVWAAVRGLPPARRAAYLLNLPRGDGLFTFVTHGAVSLRGIGQALALTPEQYERIWRHIPLDERERVIVARCANDEERFAFLVQRVPLKDAVIGAALGIGDDAVPALRSKAKAEIRRAVEGEGRH